MSVEEERRQLLRLPVEAKSRNPKWIYKSVNFKKAVCIFTNHRSKVAVLSEAPDTYALKCLCKTLQVWVSGFWTTGTNI